VGWGWERTLKVNREFPTSFQLIKSGLGGGGKMAPSGVKVVYIGRHALLPTQVRALRELNFEIVRKIENLPADASELKNLLQQLKHEGIECVLTVALPPHLLAQLSSVFPVYIFEMLSITVPTLEEAERYVADKPDWRTYLPAKAGEPVRILEFVGINQIKVTIETKRVWPPQ
jgi:hypothetical protein